MFDGCEALTSLNLSHFDTSKVTNMSWMFDGCKALTSLGVRYFDVSHVEKNEFIFKDCDKLKLENLGTWDTDESKEENTMNERSKKEAVEGLVATTMRVIENNLDLLCSYAEIFLQASGKSSLPKEALIKTTRLELGQFAMYLSASDGTVGEEEAKFISDVMTIDMTPNQIGAYIRENNIYSTQFEQTVPTMFDLFVKTEKMLRLLNNPNASIAHLILPLYEATGETLTYIDCQQSENEKTDYEIYINMLKRHLDTELGTGSAAAGFTKT
jgi:surface protein